MRVVDPRPLPRTVSICRLGLPLGGFDFELSLRNARLTGSATGAAGAPTALPKFRKTGTTICGAIFAGGVVLGADTRATEGTIVCDKNCEKIHYIAPNIYCCGAGTSADTENTTAMVSSKLQLLRLATGAASRVVTAMTMLKRYLFRYQGHVSAALVLGGVDCTGPHLYTIYPHGSTDKLPFVSMGSGSLAAMSVLESGFKDDMTEQECVRLVADAVRAGIFNDLGSGSNVDITVLRAPGAGAAGVGGVGAPAPQGAAAASAAAAAGSAAPVTIMRGFETPNDVEPLRARVKRPEGRVIARGTTVVLKTTFVKAGGAASMAGQPGVAAGGAAMEVTA